MTTHKTMEKTDEGNSSTVTVVQTGTALQPPPLVLKLHSPRTSNKVKWEEGTVDNEGKGKKSSKCCCIYEKPKVFGESSSEEESDDEDKKCKAPKAYHNALRKHKKEEKHDDSCSHCD